MAFSILMGSVGNLSLAHIDQDRIAGLVACLLRRRASA